VTCRYFLQWCSCRLPLFNLVRNSVVHLPSSVIRNPWYKNYLTALVVHSKWVNGTLCCRSPLPWCYWFRREGCIYGCLSLGDPPTPVVVPQKWSTVRYHQRSNSLWPFDLLFVVYLEINRGSPSLLSPLGCWTIADKGHISLGHFLTWKH